jgi:hypothetical protein
MSIEPAIPDLAVTGALPEVITVFEDRSREGLSRRAAR